MRIAEPELQAVGSWSTIAATILASDAALGLILADKFRFCAIGLSDPMTSSAGGPDRPLHVSRLLPEVWTVHYRADLVTAPRRSREVMEWVTTCVTRGV